jgi:hypothetical protein
MFLPDFRFDVQGIAGNLPGGQWLGLDACHAATSEEEVERSGEKVSSRMQYAAPVMHLSATAVRTRVLTLVLFVVVVACCVTAQSRSSQRWIREVKSKEKGFVASQPHSLAVHRARNK